MIEHIERMNIYIHIYKWGGEVIIILYVDIIIEHYDKLVWLNLFKVNNHSMVL